MQNQFLTLADAAARISAGDVMSIAGPSALLSQLPKGKWIGGSTVYFMADDGGVVAQDRLFCTILESAAEAVVRHIDTEHLPELASGYLEGGFSLICIPAFSSAHESFARNAMTYENLFDQPLVGWIAGVHLEKIGVEPTLVFDGTTGTAHRDGAVLLHVALPADLRPNVDIVNIFEQGDDPATSFVFEQGGFSVKSALVDGKHVDFAAYVTEHGIDTRLPLVANFAGASINVSFQHVDTEKGAVSFYAPVFPGVEYRIAKRVADYPAAFEENLRDRGAAQLSCNCILNFVYGGLEGKRTLGFTGPVTFGEIAYILLNQTVVTLEAKAA